MSARFPRAGPHDFEAVVGRAERLARKVLARWLAGGIPADMPEVELVRAMREDGAGKWMLFEGTYRRRPREPRADRALRFLAELRGVRAAIARGDGDQAARLSFQAALAFALLLEEMTGARAKRHGLNRSPALAEAFERYRLTARNETDAKEAAAEEFDTSAKTVERAVKYHRKLARK